MKEVNIKEEFTRILNNHDINPSDELISDLINIFTTPQKKEIDYSFEVHEYIQEIVCDYFHLNPFAIQDKKRLHTIVKARQIIQSLCVDYTNLHMVDIGFMFARKDRNTVRHSYKKVIPNYCDTNKKYREMYMDFEEKIKDFIIKKRDKNHVKETK